MSLDTAACPVCQTPISQTQFVEIQQRIRREEETKLEGLRIQLNSEAEARAKETIEEASRQIAIVADARVKAAIDSLAETKEKLQAEKNLRFEIEAQAARELKRIEDESATRQLAAVQAAIESTQIESSRQVALLEAALEQQKLAIARSVQREAEVALRHQQEIDDAKETATAAVSGELVRLRRQIEQLLLQREQMLAAAANVSNEHQVSLQAAVDRANTDAEAKHAAQIANLCSARDELSGKLTDAEKRLQDKETSMDAALQKQRLVLDEAKSAEIAKIRAEQFQDNEALRKKLAEAERKLDQKSSNELGQIPEDQLERELRDAFRDDDIVRVKRGQPGADLIVTVKYKDQPCGKIVIDSKNHLQWRDSFAEKLAQDCMAAEAKHAILSTVAFPKGSKDLSVKDGVILAKPNQIVTLVDVLRKTMVLSHVSGLGVTNEGKKKDRLYELISSDSYRQSIQLAERILGELQQIDVDEAADHKKVWEQRGSRLRRLDRLMHESNDSIVAIVESTEVSVEAELDTQVVRTRVPL